jgi:hypothetical protein
MARVHTSGHEEIGRFYDTFIGPRQIIFHRDFDVVSGATVIRELMLEIVMAPAVSLDVPMHLRYQLRESDRDWSIERLCAHWELPLMVVQMLRALGIAAAAVAAAEREPAAQPRACRNGGIRRRVPPTRKAGQALRPNISRRGRGG